MLRTLPSMPQYTLVLSTYVCRFQPSSVMTRPMIASLSPPAYASALSKKLQPASWAACMHSSAMSSFSWLSNVTQLPKEMTDTWRPLRPSRRYFIFVVMGCTLPPHRACARGLLRRAAAAMPAGPTLISIHRPAVPPRPTTPPDGREVQRRRWGRPSSRARHPTTPHGWGRRRTARRRPAYRPATAAADPRRRGAVQFAPDADSHVPRRPPPRRRQRVPAARCGCGRSHGERQPRRRSGVREAAQFLHHDLGLGPGRDRFDGEQVRRRRHQHLQPGAMEGPHLGPGSLVAAVVLAAVAEARPERPDRTGHTGGPAGTGHVGGGRQQPARLRGREPGTDEPGLAGLIAGR